MKKKRSLLLYETEISWFALAGVLDVVLTFLILRYSSEGRTQNLLIEGNPVARSIIQAFGIPGMITFKLVMVAVVCLIAEVVGRSRPQTGRNLLRFGTLVVGAVVVYSFFLLRRNVDLPVLQRFMNLFG